MSDAVIRSAEELRSAYGAAALAECWRRLNDATAARNHADGIYWADVGACLRTNVHQRRAG